MDKSLQSKFPKSEPAIQSKVEGKGTQVILSEKVTHWKKWTKEMDAFLLENYAWIGDRHLSEMFAKKFPQPYPWTKKHIEKRRSYLKLKRSKEQEHIIRVINNWDGRQVKTWDARGRMAEGEVRSWEGRKYIKVKGKVFLYTRYISGAKKGQVARSFEGGVKLITHAEHARMNNAMRAALPSDLKKTIKALNQLKKIINGKENPRPERNAV